MLTALYADANGTIYDAPGYKAVASDGSQTVLLRPDDMILLPDGAELIARREEQRLSVERTLIRSNALILHCLACEGLPIPSPDAKVQGWLGLKPAESEAV